MCKFTKPEQEKGRKPQAIPGCFIRSIFRSRHVRFRPQPSKLAGMITSQSINHAYEVDQAFYVLKAQVPLRSDGKVAMFDGPGDVLGYVHSPAAYL